VSNDGGSAVPAALSARTPRLVGAVTFVVGALDVLSGLFRAWRPRLHPLMEVLPGTVTASFAASIITGVLLLPLAHGLRRHKLRAWRVAIVLLAVSSASALLRVEILHTVLSLGLLITLLVTRAQFRALGDPTTRWRAVRVFLLLVVADLSAGMAVVYSARRAIVGGQVSFLTVMHEAAVGLVGLDGPLQFRTGGVADVVGTALAGLGLMTGLVTAYIALRAPEPRAELTAEDGAKLRLLLMSSPDSLGYFNLRRDKSVIWSDSGKAAVAYRVVGGVMLASGDPIGDPEAWPGAMTRFLREAADHAWTPAVLGCSERAGLAWTRLAGFSAMELGDEAVLEVRNFSLQGRPMRNVRQMVGRVRRAGYDTRVCRVADLSPGERQAVLEDAASWRRSETERGFSMALGRTADPLDPEAVLVTASQDGRVRGLLQLVPWGQRGMSLDLMRRDSAAEPGINELLISAAMQAAPALGVERVSLNFAVFRAVLERGERLGAGPLVRAWRTILIFASRWFQIESLYRFNAKFQPEWQPRYLIYPGPADLPRVGVAALEAEAFFVWPSFRRLREGKP